jgi:ABC-type uncharacterized transport system substrate-binding protein
MGDMKRILAVAVGPHRDLVISAKGDLSTVRPYIAGLVNGLIDYKRELGTDYVIDYREREPHQLEDEEHAETAFRVLAETPHQLVFAMSTTALQAAKGVTNDTVPIVFPSVSDHKADGLLRRGNATGVSARRSQTAGECFARFLASVPTLKEVRVLTKPGYYPAERALKLVKTVAKKHKITIKEIAVTSRGDIEKKLSAMAKRDLKKPAEAGLLVLPVDLCLGAAPLIIELAQGRKNIPVFFPVTDWVRATAPSAFGGYGVPQHRCGKLAAEHVDQILWGSAKAGTLKVTEAADDAFDWALSSTVARALNINIPRVVG